MDLWPALAPVFAAFPQKKKTDERRGNPQLNPPGRGWGNIFTTSFLCSCKQLKSNYTNRERESRIKRRLRKRVNESRVGLAQFDRRPINSKDKKKETLMKYREITAGIFYIESHNL